MEEGTGTLLHLGCGKVRWPGWIGVDLIPGSDIEADLKSLPLPDDHADAAAAIHVLEHLYAWEAGDALKEWKRVLKPGGKLILELPSMDKVMSHIIFCHQHGIRAPMGMTWFAMWGDPKYRDPVMCHKWGYTAQSLGELLEDCGYRGITFSEPRYHFKERDMRVEAYK